MLESCEHPEKENLHLFQKPYGRGDLSEKVCHVLMCAVPVKGGRALANEMVEFNLNAKTIDWLFSLYPEAKKSHAITDYVFKQIDHSTTDEKSGKKRKKTVKELFAGGIDTLCEIFTSPFLRAHNCNTFIVHCVPARTFMCEQFSGDSGLAPEWEIFRDVDIGGKLAHQSYLNVYADQKNLNKFVELIERQQVELDIKVDLSKLQKRLRAMAALPEANSFPHLKDVVVEFSSEEEMLAKREEFLAWSRQYN
ncbi:hypothetical protein LTR56_028144, partial [Elasticomyces elasticus]